MNRRSCFVSEVKYLHESTLRRLRGLCWGMGKTGCSKLSQRRQQKQCKVLLSGWQG